MGLMMLGIVEKLYVSSGLLVLVKYIDCMYEIIK